jgi:hypothetical protein
MQVNAVQQSVKFYSALLLRVAIKVEDFPAYVQLAIRVKR